MKRSIDQLQGEEESERFDFKRFDALDDSRKFAKHLVGFANRHGGEIALGFDNSGNIEGREIDYDMTMQTITNIAYSRCSPQIRFEDDYLRTPKGDVLILDISPRGEIPHAVVELSEGTIESRDYWIRTKNSTRRISDSELHRLFSTTLDPDFSREFRVWSMLSIDELQIPGVKLPDSIDYYRTLIGRLDLDSTVDLDDESFRTSYIAQELFPFTFILSLNRLHYSTWDTVIKNSRSPLQDTSLFGPNLPTMVGSSDLDQDHESDSIEIDEGDIQFSGYGDTILSEFADPINLLQDIQFKAPPNTKFSIEYEIDDADGDEPLPFPKYHFRIQRGDELKVSITNLGGQYGRGFPTNHPLTDVAVDNKFRRIDLGDIQSKWEHADIRNRFSTEFGFPDVPDTNIQLNEKYVDRLWHVIEEQFSVQYFLEQLPETELYKANYKLDMIIEALFE